VVGIILIAAQSPREIRNDEQHLLSTLADIAGNAIHRTRLYEQTQRNLDRLASLRAIDQAITSNNELDLTLNILLGYAKNQLNADAAGILRLDPITNTLNYTNGQGFGSMFRPPSPIRVGEGYAGMAVLERRPIFTSDLDETGTAFVTGRIELSTYEMFQSYHVIPLFSKGIVRGVLETFHRTRFDPDEEWKDYFESLASQAAIAIDNAELFNSLQKSNLDLIVAYDATIEGWSRALDLRDRETEGHTQRVAGMALDLAKLIGVKDEKLLHIRRGALLHDIGKMGIPDQILFKEGPLDKAEWDIMRKHPIFAYEMLSPINYLKSALDIPYCHHEKWDGTGYPRGRAGEQIPLAARIFAVADVWDALTSKRPYREAWSEEDTHSYIIKNSSLHFDPMIVEAFSTLSPQ
jgi:putative nucleotidyltransferase with HDIG domain